MNPEKMLEEIVTAIKHRTISLTLHWYIVYYHDRITCVPSSHTIPPEIIIGGLSEKQVQDGFTPAEWNSLKANIAKLYKELNK